MGGWNVRPSDWGLVASIQQQVLPRTSVEFNYSRRWLNNFTVTDNLATATSDYRPFSIVAPTDSRLGAASGATLNQSVRADAGGGDGRAEPASTRWRRTSGTSISTSTGS